MDTIKKLSDYSLLNEATSVLWVFQRPLIMTWQLQTIHLVTEVLQNTSVPLQSEVIRDGLVYDQQNVTILEIMGRNAGWLTGAAALAKCEDCEGPDMIFLPEVTFDVDEFMKKVAELHKKKKSVVVAVSGCKDGRRQICM